MPDKIKITDVEGGNDRDDLKNCYFQPVSAGVYNLYAQDNTLLASEITSGSSFQFTLQDLIWTIPNPANVANPFVIDPKRASGSWIINGPASPLPEEGDESGTFQAQAGGSGDPEEEASSAYA